jgi:hypothetical protein
VVTAALTVAGGASCLPLFNNTIVKNSLVETLAGFVRPFAFLRSAVRSRGGESGGSFAGA